MNETKVPPPGLARRRFPYAANLAIIRLMFDRIKHFFKESEQELRHVNWPTRQEATRLTAIVIGIALGLAVFLGAFDYLFTYILKTYII
jgi:preprotein translocase subunit SecE